MDPEYTIEEAAAVLEKAVERKRLEIASLEKRKRRLRKESSVAETQEIIDYLEADVTAYLTVIADMKDDDTILEGLDLDRDEAVECPVGYDRYVSGLCADDLENELEADAIRAEYCEDVIEELCQNIGEKALGSKKMIKFMLDDPATLEAIGELIFYDDYLYDAFKALGSEPKGKKKKKRKD